MIYLNENFVEETEAKISVKDRGLRFGDGVFETISCYNGTAYQLEDHLERLKGGLDELKIKFDVSTLPAIIRQALEKNSVKDGFVRIMITRGEGSRGYLPTYKSSPTVIVEAMTSPEMTTETAALMVSSYSRVSNKALPTQYKLMNGLNSTLAKMEAKEKGFFDAIMLDDSGNIAEVSAGNIFFVENGALYTPSLETGALAGTMRKNILKHNNVRQGLFKLSHLEKAEEIFITNTVWKVLPVSTIEGLNFKPVSDKVSKKIKESIELDIKQRCLST